MPKIIKTNNGAIEVSLQDSDFATSNKLRAIFTKSVKKQGYKLEELGNVETIEVLDCNEELQEILFKCLERCTYDGVRITKETFEPISARQDYYEIMLACLGINYDPFFKAPALSSKD